MSKRGQLRLWTAEEVETMDLMARMGKRPEDVAKALNRTVAAVVCKAHAKSIRFVDQRTGKHLANYGNKPKKVSDKALGKLAPPKNVEVPKRPNAIGSVDWAV